MNDLRKAKRADWWCLVAALVVIAGGCRTSSQAVRGTPPAVAAAKPTAGASLDDIDARNRENLAAQLGRPVAPGPATPSEVVAMARAGIESRQIICYINRSTNMAPVTAEDIIYMHDQGVNEQVIQAMLTPGSAYSRAEVARDMPPRVYILPDRWSP